MAEFNKTEHEGEDSNPIPGKDEQETPVEFPEKLKNEIQNMISEAIMGIAKIRVPPAQTQVDPEKARIIETLTSMGFKDPEKAYQKYYGGE